MYFPRDGGPVFRRFLRSINEINHRLITLNIRFVKISSNNLTIIWYAVRYKWNDKELNDRFNNNKSSNKI